MLWLPFKSRSLAKSGGVRDIRILSRESSHYGACSRYRVLKIVTSIKFPSNLDWQWPGNGSTRALARLSSIAIAQRKFAKQHWDFGMMAPRWSQANGR